VTVTRALAHVALSNVCDCKHRLFGPYVSFPVASYPIARDARVKVKPGSAVRSPADDVPALNLAAAKLRST
jgi:hypothetical protein